MPEQLIHRDFHLYNLLFCDGRPSGYLDFDMLMRGPRLFDVCYCSIETLAKRFDFNNRALGLSVAFSAIGDYAFVGLLGNNAVEVLDAYDGGIVSGAFELGKAPDGLVLDDAGHLFVNSFLSRSVVVLDATMNDHVLRWHSFEPHLGEVTFDGMQTIRPEWRSPAQFPGAPLPAPVLELLTLWREWRVGDVQAAITELESAGYRTSWVQRP